MTEAAPAVTPAGISSYIKAHERLIVILVLAGLSFVIYSKGVAYLVSRDQLAASKATQVLQAQAEINAKEATDAKQTLLQYQQLAQQLIASNQAIALAQQKLAVDTQKQQAVDKTLPPAALAARWTDLVKVSPETVQPSKEGYTVSQDTAQQTVSQLEAVPQLQTSITDWKQINSNDNKQIAGQDGVINSLHNQVDGLNKQITDADKACQAQITVVKAEARKSKLRWFIGGFVAGFISRQLIKP